MSETIVRFQIFTGKWFSENSFHEILPHSDTMAFKVLGSIPRKGDNVEEFEKTSLMLLSDIALK